MKTQEWKDYCVHRNIGIGGSNAKYETGMKELNNWKEELMCSTLIGLMSYHPSWPLAFALTSVQMARCALACGWSSSIWNIAYWVLGSNQPFELFQLCGCGDTVHLRCLDSPGQNSLCVLAPLLCLQERGKNWIKFVCVHDKLCGWI